MLRQVIYTSVVGNFDLLLAPVVIEPQFDYVVFCEGTDATIPPPWQCRPLTRRERNARMTARWHKLHPHLLFPEYDLSLYIDGNVQVNAPVSALIDQMSTVSPIALFRHAERDCIYAEAETVKRYRLDDWAIVDAQTAYYRALGYPTGHGLHVSSIQVRRHNDPRLTALLDDWWQQVKIFSQRDQLSLDFMLMRHGIAAATIPGSVTQNAWFTVAPHRRHRVEFAGNHNAGTVDALDWLRMSMIALASRSPADQRRVPRLKQAIWWHTTEPLRSAKRLLRRQLWRVRRGWRGSNFEALAHRQSFAFAPPILAPVTSRCPKVSVLVTNYNMGRFVVEAVHSALSQSYDNIEIVICDDGSEDDSLARIEASFKNNARIAYFTQPNAGQAAAMNAAFVRATGELIAFLDSDDVWLPDRLRRVVERFTASPGLGILSHQLRAVDEKLRPLRFVAPDHFDEGWLGWNPLAVARLSKARTTGLTVHREVADRVFPLPTDSRGHGDGVMVRRAAVLARVGALHEIHALYRQHAGNQTGITGPTQVKDAEAELRTRRIALSDHVSFYRSVFGQPVGDENFVRQMTAYDELSFDLLAGRPLDRQLIRLLPRLRTRGWWLLLAALPRRAAIASFRFRRRQAW